jgi:dihydrofolate reductase
MKITVINHLTLDGVMQAPGRPDEDTRGGFSHGGWAASRNDAVMLEAVGQRMGRGGALLLGRRTYQDFFSFWPGQKDNPFSKALDDMQKYVVSTTLTEPLPWKHSTLLDAGVLAKLKEQAGPDLTIMGSGELIQSLIGRNLIDEYLLMIHPIVLGAGRRLFRENGAPANLRLADAKGTTRGVVLATYRAS